MKAITLTEPWASLVMLGTKRYETRSWPTSYRGPLAIHAGKGLAPVGGRAGFEDTTGADPFYSALLPRYWNPCDPTLYCLGAIIATCILADCVRVESIRDKISYQEQAFGYYTDGRWAWRLEDVQALDDPIFIPGALGLWKWSREGMDELQPSLFAAPARGQETGT